MNRLKNLLILIIILSSFYLIFVQGISFPCLFKTIFDVPCPACGMTRALISILRFDFINAFFYNILSIPLFFILITMFIIIVFDFIFNKSIFLDNIFKILKKYYLLIFIALLLSFIVNIFRQV